MTFDTPLGPRTFNATNHETDAGEYWSLVVTDPKYPIPRHEGSGLPTTPAPPAGG